jgi:FKBP-type peptidyl-prolyl cis-trans isomerase FkpA
MRKTKFLFFGYLIIGLLISCSKKPHTIDGYEYSEDGFYYKLQAIGDGNNKPLQEQVVIVEAVMKTLSDSVFWDTNHDAANGLYIPLYKKWGQFSCNPYFINVAEGDSVSFLIRPSIFFRNYFDTIIPNFCMHDSLIKLDVKVEQFISKSEYLELQKMATSGYNEDTELEELQYIDSYLLNKYTYVKPDCNGIYWIDKKTTNLQPAKYGNKIKIEFEGSFIDGKSIDAGKQQLEFIYGTPDQLIKGLNIVIGSLKKGETAKIILPSRLAFGEQGSSNGTIKPYTPVAYTITIIDIK